jgi:hypothetical protein
LEVWTIDPRFPFHHPEHPEEKPEISAPIENEVEEMREYGLRYAVLINPRDYGWDNSYVSYSLASEPYKISLEGFPYRDTWPFFLPSISVATGSSRS